MEQLTISSKLDGFMLLDGIDTVTADTIKGRAVFNRTPVYTGLEAMAQLGALHVRRQIDFKAHAFLLKVIQCRLPGVARLDGRYLLQAARSSHSRRAYTYVIRARGPRGIVIDGDFLFACVDYDNAFQETALQNHYETLFTCLQNATAKN